MRSGMGAQRTALRGNNMIIYKCSIQPVPKLYVHYLYDRQFVVRDGVIEVEQELPAAIEQALLVSGFKRMECPKQ